MTSSFIQNQILWAEKEPYRHNLSHVENAHADDHVCTHTLMMHYSPELLAFFEKIELGLGLREIGSCLENHVTY